MSRPEPRPLAPFQFRLQSLFIFMLIVAILSWLVTILPADAWLFLTFPTLPILGMTSAILGVVYLRGKWRAFWLGFGIALAHVLLLGLFTGFYWGRGFREWEALLIVPMFGAIVPAVGGWIGTLFQRAGQAAELQAAAQTPPPQPAPQTAPATPQPVADDSLGAPPT